MTRARSHPRSSESWGAPTAVGRRAQHSKSKRQQKRNTASRPSCVVDILPKMRGVHGGPRTGAIHFWGAIELTIHALSVEAPRRPLGVWSLALIGNASAHNSGSEFEN